jgi:hypothetical protein
VSFSVVIVHSGVQSKKDELSDSKDSFMPKEHASTVLCNQQMYWQEVKARKKGVSEEMNECNNGYRGKGISVQTI